MTRHRLDSTAPGGYDADCAIGAPPPGDAPVILVAEDTHEIRDLLTSLLEYEGYSVVEATDGQEALDVALDRDVDLILLDLAMPRLTGTAFGRAYRHRGGQAPVILITAALDETVAVAVETCRAVGHIRKPFDIERVLEMVELHRRSPLGRTG